jgi:1,4-alpha-glucan branching enzyme
VVAFERHDAHGGRLVVVTNFAGVTRTGYRLQLSCEGTWVEVLNTDAAEYGGSDAGNLGMIHAHCETDDAPAIATVTLPALSTIWFRYQADPHIPTVSHD